MTLDEAIEHGRAWVAAGWVWAPGQIVIIDDGTGVEGVHLVTGVAMRGRPMVWGVVTTNAVPDLRDRGTLGHALGQVRDAWAKQDPLVARQIWPEPLNITSTLWRVQVPAQDGRGVNDHEGASEAEALLAARRAAP